MKTKTFILILALVVLLISFGFWLSYISVNYILSEFNLHLSFWRCVLLVGLFGGYRYCGGKK